MSKKPPKFFDRLLQWYCKQSDMEDIQGDFYEVYYDRLEVSVRNANLHFALDTLKLFNPFSNRRKRSTWLSESYHFNFRNQIRRSIRNLRRFPFINVLKIIGLGLAISAFLFINDYARYHNTFDQFHSNKDRIYRIVTTIESPDISDVTAWSHYYVPDIKDEIPAIQHVVRLLKTELALVVKAQNQSYKESEIFYADPEFASVFGYTWLEGSPQTALKEESSVILTRSIAEKYFGSSLRVVGKTIDINDQSYIITGLIEDVPSNSDLAFDLLIPFPEYNFEDWVFVYVLIHPDASVQELEEDFSRVIQNYNDDYFTEAAGVSLSYDFENIKDIHYSQAKLYDTPKMDKSRIQLFQLIGWIILLIAFVNYINLYSTQLLNRIRGVNVQMVVGASKKQLFVEFATEASLYLGLALFSGLLLTVLFEDIVSYYAKFDFFDIHISFSMIMNLGGLFFALILLSSIYALAITTSRKNNQLFETKVIKAPLRRALIGIQFALSFGIILATLVIYQQTSLIQNQPLGFDSRNTIHFEFPTNLKVSEIGVIIDELATLESVESISRVEYKSIPGEEPWVEEYFIEKSTKSQIFEELAVDEHYLEGLQLNLLEGDFLSASSSYYKPSFVVNKSFVSHMGWEMEEAIGKNLRVYEQRGKIVGVIDNFFFNSPHDLIQPMILRYFPYGRTAIVRINQEKSIRESIYQMEEIWHSHIPDLVFNFSFLDDDYKKQFEQEHATLNVLGIIAGLVILLSLLGIYAILLMLVKAREKELGIRKVNGANQKDLFNLFSKEFFVILFIGILASVPVCWMGISKWLEKYPLRIDLSPLYFIITALFILLMIGAVIYIQANRAYQSNTIDALKYE